MTTQVVTMTFLMRLSSENAVLIGWSTATSHPGSFTTRKAMILLSPRKLYVPNPPSNFSISSWSFALWTMFFSPSCWTGCSTTFRLTKVSPM